MKKRNVFSTWASLLVLLIFSFATAQATATIDLYPVPVGTTWYSVAVTTEAANYQGTSYQLWLKYKPAGDTVMHYTTPTAYNYALVQSVITGLPASNLVQVWAVMVDGTDTVTSLPQSFPTLASPHKAYIANPQILSSPSQTVVTFSYNVSVPTKFFVRYHNYVDTSNTFIVSAAGSGNGQVVITNPNIPDSTYSGNFLRGTPIQTGVVPDSTKFLPSFTVPSWSTPDVGNTITFSSVTQDSFHFTASITKGNSPNAAVYVYDLDSNGNVTYTRPVFVITHDTTFTETRLSSPNTLSGERVIVITNAGSDSATGMKRTLEVLTPDVVSVDTTNAGTSTTDLVLNVKTNGKSSWPTSTSHVWAKWKDKNGNLLTSPQQTVAGSSATVSITVTGLNNLKQNPQTNQVTAYIQNDAGLIDSLFASYVIKAPTPAVPIDNGWYIDANSAFEIRIWHINAGPSSAMYQVIALIKVVGSGSVDTLTLRANQTGYTDFLQWDTIGNRNGNTAYEIRLATKNVDGILNITTTKTITTLQSVTQTFYIANGYTVTNNSIDFKVSGCANGTPSYLQIELARQSQPGTVIYSNSLGYLGTGNFSVTSSVDNLDDCTGYVLKAILHNGQMGNQVPDEKSFTTDCANGVLDVNEEKFKIYPTTVENNLSLTSPTIIGEVAIYEIETGRQLMRQYLNTTNASIDLSGLSSGTYVLRTTTETHRFFKQ